MTTANKQSLKQILRGNKYGPVYLNENTNTISDNNGLYQL